eukprot:1252441-Lingulodinium_polyedra.AAC.1
MCIRDSSRSQRPCAAESRGASSPPRPRREPSSSTSRSRDGGRGASDEPPAEPGPLASAAPAGPTLLQGVHAVDLSDDPDWDAGPPQPPDHASWEPAPA